jgi:sulfur carrier protein
LKNALHSDVITLSINGVPKQFPEPLNLRQLVEVLGLAGRRVAIEHNGEIVPRSGFAETGLEDGDTLEIVIAVGGG